VGFDFKMFGIPNWGLAIRARFRDFAFSSRYFWYWLIVCFAIVLVCRYFPQAGLPRSANLSDRTRWAGMLFQIAGVFCVIVGLNDSKTFFGESGLVGSAWTVFKSMFHIFDRPRVVQVSAHIGVGSAMGATARANAPQVNPTTESRLLELETKVGGLESALARAEKELELHAVELVRVEREERVSAITDTSNKLRAVVTGDIALQPVGAAFLIVGIVLISIPDELAALWT
jgi:hypothetical protein